MNWNFLSLMDVTPHCFRSSKTTALAKNQVYPWCQTAFIISTPIFTRKHFSLENCFHNDFSLMVIATRPSLYVDVSITINDHWLKKVVNADHIISALEYVSCNVFKNLWYNYYVHNFVRHSVYSILAVIRSNLANVIQAPNFEVVRSYANTYDISL